MPSPLQIKIDKTKKFVKKYQVPIAFSVGAVATCYVIRDVQLYSKRDILDAVRSVNVIDHTEVVVPVEDTIEHQMLVDFIVDKGLRDEFFDYKYRQGS
jgi:hypothetical protein